MKLTFYTILTATILFGCKKSNDDGITTIPLVFIPGNYYYPSLTGDVWEKKTAASIGWDDALLQQAFDFAGTKILTA